MYDDYHLHEKKNSLMKWSWETLLTPRETVSFVSLRPSMFKAKGNIEVKGKQNSLFPAGPVIKCFVIPPNSKLEKPVKKLFALRRLAHKLGSLREFWSITCDTFSSNRKTYLSWKVKQHGIMMQEFLMTSMGWLWIFPGLLSCMCIISRFGRQPCLLDDISESLLSWQTCNHQGLLILSRSVHCFSTLFRLRRLKRVFHFCSVYQTMEDYKEGHLMVWTNYMSPCSSIVELYFKGTCDVISVTMATHKVHKSVL